MMTTMTTTTTTTATRGKLSPDSAAILDADICNNNNNNNNNNNHNNHNNPIPASSTPTPAPPLTLALAPALALALPLPPTSHPHDSKVSTEMVVRNSSHHRDQQQQSVQQQQHPHHHPHHHHPHHPPGLLGISQKSPAANNGETATPTPRGGGAHVHSSTHTPAEKDVGHPSPLALAEKSSDASAAEKKASASRWIYQQEPAVSGQRPTYSIQTPRSKSREKAKAKQIRHRLLKLAAVAGTAGIVVAVVASANGFRYATSNTRFADAKSSTPECGNSRCAVVMIAGWARIAVLSFYVYYAWHRSYTAQKNSSPV